MRPLSTIRRYLRRLGERGTATLEFGIIGSSFMLMVVAAFECGFMVFLQSSLDNAARDAARLIRTGQAQVSADPQTTFKTLLCDEVNTLIPCSSLLYQSSVYSSWSGAQTGVNTAPTRDKNGNLVSSGFTIGTSGQIVVVQVTYNYSFFTPWIGQLLGSGTNSAFLMSTVVFQNEPF